MDYKYFIFFSGVICIFLFVFSSCSFFTPEKIAKDEEILLNAAEEIVEVGIGVQHEKRD